MNNDQEKQRAVHLMILICYTISTMVLTGESLLLGWDMSVIVLLICGMMGSWYLHITRRIPGELSLWVYITLSMLSFFFYGIHDTSMYDLAPVMILLIIIFSATENRHVIQVCWCVYVITMCYGFLFVVRDTIELSPLVITRTMLHFIVVFMASYLVKLNIQRHEREKRSTKEQIQKLEEANQRIEDFLTNVSHELRTPINAVTGITAVMLKGENDEEKRNDILAVQQAGQRLFGQIEDILDYTEIDTGRLSVGNDPYMMSSIVNDLIMGSHYGEKADAPELILDVDAKLPSMLVGDARKMKKLLKHLIDNAVKFTKKGGVYVRVYGIEKEYGINLCIEVSDTGSGIPAEDMDRIKESFFQSGGGRNRKAGGLGLGLPIVYGIAEAMEGFVQIRSKEGEGTTVLVSIPQKVADLTPSMVVKERDKLCLACYLRAEKYEVAEVRNYYNDMISHMVCGLDVTLHRVFDSEELKKLSSIYHLTHLFIAKEEYGEMPQYYEELAKNTQVIVVVDGEFKLPRNSRMILMKKPFYTLPVINILNSDYSMDAEMRGDRQMICSDVKVLVVDDEPMNLMVAQGILGNYRMIVRTAESGKEAIEICEQEDFDLLFLDHMMPEMDGVETLQKIRQIHEESKRKITAIAFTANAVSGAREMFFREGFDEFISKPIETVELERVLRRVLPKTKLSYVSAQDAACLPKQELAVSDAGEENDVKEKPECADWMNILHEAGFNTRAGLQYSSEDREFYKKILERFVSDYERNRQRLEDFYVHKDLENYRISVHALKSTSKMVGADAFSEQAKRAEYAAKEMDASYLDEHQEELLDAYAQVVYVISDALGLTCSAVEQEREQAAISQDELLSTLRELKSCLETFEAERAAALLEAMSGVTYNGKAVAELLAQVQTDIDDFEMGAAAEKVQVLIRDTEGGEA